MKLSCKFKSKIGAILVSMMLLVVGATTVYAASVGSFSFEFSTAVYGSTKYSLSNKSTSVKTTANTYSYATGNTISSQSYMVSLHKSSSIFNTFKTAGAADGTAKTVNFGTVSSGTYVVDLCATDPPASGMVYWYIKGSGNINQ
nr:hypothetical protein [uncultured Blautia sp.]